MNTLDMYTRERANKAHLDEMQREARTRHLLRTASQDGTAQNANAKRSLRLTFVFAALVILLGVFLTAAAIGL